MLKKLSWIFIPCLAASLFLASCQRAASTQVVPQATSTKISVATPTGMGQVQLIGTTQMIQTMTALAQQTKPAETATVVAARPTSTPFGTPAVPPTGVATTPAAGTTPVVIVPTLTPGRPATYILMLGEFPYCIARRFNVNVDELLSLNGLSSSTANSMQPGDILKIPQSGNPFVGDRALHTHPDTFTVTSSKDTIYSIACYYGNVDPTQIIAANSLVSPYTLHINQVLQIP
jgi:LysM repeat protein